LESAISTVEPDEAAGAPGAVEHQIDEEIEEIKRYEVCANNSSRHLLATMY
jgi:chloride channel 3/4/5